MLFRKLQLGLADLLLQIGSCRADLIINDVELADSACFLKNIRDNLADNSIYFFGMVGGGPSQLPLCWVRL